MPCMARKVFDITLSNCKESIFIATMVHLLWALIIGVRCLAKKRLPIFSTLFSAQRFRWLLIDSLAYRKVVLLFAFVFLHAVTTLEASEKNNWLKWIVFVAQAQCNASTYSSQSCCSMQAYTIIHLGLVAECITRSMCCCSSKPLWWSIAQLSAWFHKMSLMWKNILFCSEAIVDV